jgi:hypothetical protein
VTVAFATEEAWPASCETTVDASESLAGCASDPLGLVPLYEEGTDFFGAGGSFGGKPRIQEHIIGFLIGEAKPGSGRGSGLKQSGGCNTNSGWTLKCLVKSLLKSCGCRRTKPDMRRHDFSIFGDRYHCLLSTAVAKKFGMPTSGAVIDL